MIVWIIFVGIMCATAYSFSSFAWGKISIVAAGLTVGSFALSYLGGHIIRGNKGAIRLGMLISVLWVVGSFVTFEPFSKRGSWTEFLGIGIIPVVSYLGILWVISGFLSNKNKMETSTGVNH